MRDQNSINDNSVASSAQYAGKERRSASRLSCITECLLQFEDGLELTGNIQNISFTGTFVDLNYLEIGSLVNQRVWLNFNITIRSRSNDFRVNGAVVRATKTGVGIAFRQSEKSYLEPFIQRLKEELEEQSLTLTSRGVER